MRLWAANAVWDRLGKQAALVEQCSLRQHASVKLLEEKQPTIGISKA